MTVLAHHAQFNMPEHWLTFEEFVELADKGAFGQSKHLELIDGRIIDLAPISTDHLIGTSDAAYHLRFAFEHAGVAGGRLIGGPVTVLLDETRAPQPDAVVARRTGERWLTAKDVELVVEVAVTTQDYDLKFKPILYAQAGIPEYWVVDRPARNVHVFRSPLEGMYTEGPSIHGVGDILQPICAPGVSIRAADLL